MRHGDYFMITYPGAVGATGTTFYKKGMEEPGSNDGIAYYISQRYPRLRTSFQSFFIILFIQVFLISLL